MNQDKALAFLKAGKNVFLTGSAGTGKTYVLNQYIQHLKAHKISVGVTASTGIAATHIQGMTIHGFSGMGVRDHIDRKTLNSMASKKYLKTPLTNIKVLIIDEISMLHKNQLEMVNTILQYFKNSAKPFGGIQVVVCGDFFQLPPIGNDQTPSKDKFCFMSPVWVEAGFHICYLTEQYRQNNDVLTDILNEIRLGEISGQAIQRLKDRNVESTTKDITQLFTHNVDVERINNAYLQQLTTTEKIFLAKTTGNPNLIETLSKSVLTSVKLKLKREAKVMFIKNNAEKGYVNGTIGMVKSFNEEGYPVVQTQNGKYIVAEPEDWEIRNESGKKLAGFRQVPLQLAWAITIHKSQGMTLDQAEIDLSKTFEKGQGYVALSRLKALENLYLKGFNELALQSDPLAYKADVRFRQLSKEIDVQHTLEELKLQHNPFIEFCDGKLIPDKKLKSDSSNSTNTFKKGETLQSTMEMLSQKIPLTQIAEQRGLKLQTIYGHLKKIIEQYPEIDLSHYHPSPEIIQKVRQTYQQLYPPTTPENEIRLKPIFEALEEQVSYDDIKLSIIFF